MDIITETGRILDHSVVFPNVSSQIPFNYNGNEE
jgi:hypothetical protein